MPHLPESAPESPKAEPAADARRPWVTPVVAELPPLTSLTLQTGGPIGGGGGTGGGGSTVF